MTLKQIKYKLSCLKEDIYSKLETKKMAYRRREKSRLKYSFRSYFEGSGYEDWSIDPIEPILIKKFGITDIQFKFKKNLVEMTITLERPGILIGKGGRTIDGVSKFLSSPEQRVKILIIESKLWR